VSFFPQPPRPLPGTNVRFPDGRTGVVLHDNDQRIPQEGIYVMWHTDVYVLFDKPVSSFSPQGQATIVARGGWFPPAVLTVITDATPPVTVPCARCKHDRDAHRHYRPGTGCALCPDCPTFQWSVASIVGRVKQAVGR
jgi:hypothetical protein